MSLQDTFYIIGIICMTLYTLLLIVIVVLLFYIKKKITDMYKIVEEKIETAKEIITHPKRAAVVVGATVADVALSKAEKFIKKKQQKK